MLQSLVAVVANVDVALYTAFAAVLIVALHIVAVDKVVVSFLCCCCS